MVTSSTQRSAARALLLDLDGVIWLAHQPIPGSVDAVERARRAGWRVVFVTNNSAATIAENEAALAAIGIPAVGDVVSSALAAASLLEPGDRVLVSGGFGVVEAVERRGAFAVHEPPFDAVIVGFHRTFDYEGLRRTATAVRQGARLIGTNDDATYPTPDGLIPGGGAILAAVAVGSGADPVLAGKPHAAMAELVRQIIGEANVKTSVMVGDRPSTDGLFARELGCRYAHVWSGVTDRGTRIEPIPDLTGDDLGAVVDQLLADDELQQTAVPFGV
ncbi:MAG: putative phosphatase [Acidimicrobiaceae bacterium]|nr:MAG: putative phosphatase [Acidimicrobiaceae bacterium]